jgi:hypothetical protein
MKSTLPGVFTGGSPPDQWIPGGQRITVETGPPQ